MPKGAAPCSENLMAPHLHEKGQESFVKRLLRFGANCWSAVRQVGLEPKAALVGSVEVLQVPLSKQSAQDLHRKQDGAPSSKKKRLGAAQ